MADDCDLATDLAEREREAILSRRRAVQAPAAVGDRTCRDCGDPIEPRRLAVLPTTTWCAECARDADRRSR